MKRFGTIGLLMGAAMLSFVPNAAAQRWGREALPRAGVCFYENINFEGSYFCSPAGATTDSVPSGTNDRISSIRLFGNSEVTIFRDPNLRGQSRVINSSVADLRGMGFNDRISSFSVESNRGFGNNGNGNGGFGNNGNANNRGRMSYREAEAMVRRSYRDVLGRDADASGLRSWTEQVMRNNWTQRDLENAFRQTDEYRATSGTTAAGADIQA